MPQQPVNTGFGSYPNMLPNGYVSMPNYLNVNSTSHPTQTATCPSRDTWSIPP
jgi:hypothetical protein